MPLPAIVLITKVVIAVTDSAEIGAECTLAVGVISVRLCAASKRLTCLSIRHESTVWVSCSLILQLNTEIHSDIRWYICSPVSLAIRSSTVVMVLLQGLLYNQPL